MVRAKGNLFSVMWRVTAKAPTMRGEYEADDLKSLFRALHHAENVSTSTCVELVVHHHQGPGTVEVFAHDSETNVTHLRPQGSQGKALTVIEGPPVKLNKKERRAARNRESQASRETARNRATTYGQQAILIAAGAILDGVSGNTPTTKPHIRLTTPADPPSVSAAHGLYRAYKA